MLLRIVCVHGFQPSLSWKDSKSNSLIVRDDNKFPKISVLMRHANFVIAFARITDSRYNGEQLNGSVIDNQIVSGICL